MQVSWASAFLYIELAPEHMPRMAEVEGAIAELFPAGSAEVRVEWFRPARQEEWLPVIEEICGPRGAGAPKLVWWLQNDDHPFVDSSPNTLQEGLQLLAADPAPFVSLYFSHWTEAVRLSGKLGNAERVGRSYVRFEATLTDAVQVFNSRFLWFLFSQLDWKGEAHPRIDNLIQHLAVFSVAGANGLVVTSRSMQSIYVPLRELCRHFGGYGHVGMSEQLWPPMSLAKAPASYTVGRSSAQLVSMLTARHGGLWMNGNSFQLPQEWLRTMLELYGAAVPPAGEPVQLSPEDMP
jgi:hypothetical protein